MKIVTIARYNEVEQDFYQQSRQVRGVRMQYKRKNMLMLGFFGDPEETKLPDNIIGFVVKENENLGTKRWPDMCKACHKVNVLPCETVRETEKSYIIEMTRGHYTHKQIVSKSKVVGFIVKEVPDEH